MHFFLSAKESLFKTTRSIISTEARSQRVGCVGFCGRRDVSEHSEGITRPTRFIINQHDLKKAGARGVSAFFVRETIYNCTLIYIKEKMKNCKYVTAYPFPNCQVFCSILVQRIEYSNEA